MEVGTKVKVSNPLQINYKLEGEVIEEETAPVEGIKMSLVKFKYTKCWYADDDLKEIGSN